MGYDRAGAFIHEAKQTIDVLYNAERFLANTRVDSHSSIDDQNRVRADLARARNDVETSCAALLAEQPAVAYQHLVPGEEKSKQMRERLREVWQQRLVQRRPLAWDTGKWFQNTFGPSFDLTLLPAGSFAIEFPFQLDRPYLSRNDVGLSILDNPVRMERVFRVPMVAPSSWKGSVRAALRTRHNWTNTHPNLDLLCGSTARQGRLHFFPTFFDRIGLEVIAPHDREMEIAKKGISPILYESAPVTAKGEFALVYVPFDIPFNPAKSPVSDVMRETGQHLTAVAAALSKLFTLYGFGAKTSSGFGRAAPELPDNEEGAVKVREPAGPRVVEPFRFRYFDELATRAAAYATEVAKP